MPDKIQRIQLIGDEGTRFVECVLRRSSRARRINLRVTSRDRAILALPNRLSWSEAFSFLANQREWLSKKTQEFPSVTRLDEYFRRGGKVSLDMNPRVLEWTARMFVSGIQFRLGKRKSLLLWVKKETWRSSS